MTLAAAASVCLARRRRAPMNKSSLMNAKVALRLWLDFGVLVECFGFKRIYFEFHLSNLCSNKLVYFLCRIFFTAASFEGAALKCAAGHWRAHSAGVTPVQQLDYFSQTFYSKMSGSWVSQRILLTGPTHRTFTTFILKNETYKATCRLKIKEYKHKCPWNTPELNLVVPVEPLLSEAPWLSQECAEMSLRDVSTVSHWCKDEFWLQPPACLRAHSIYLYIWNWENLWFN